MAASSGGAAGNDHVSPDSSWKKGCRQPAPPLLLANTHIVDTSGGSVVVTPDLRNLSEMGFGLCDDYQDENGESEAMRAEYYAITHVRSAKRRVTVGPGDREGRARSEVLFRDCQKVTERQAAIRAPSSGR